MIIKNFTDPCVLGALLFVVNILKGPYQVCVVIPETY